MATSLEWGELHEGSEVARNMRQIRAINAGGAQDTPS